MKVGINASFLRKPGTGIGEVTANVLQEIAKATETPDAPDGATEYLIYCEESPAGPVPYRFRVRVITPWWRRDDLVRKVLWERWQLPRAAAADGCDVFWNLYQCPTMFAEGPGGQKIRHIMLVHDVIPGLFPEYLGNMRKKAYWRMTERGIRSSDLIVAVSDSTKRDIVSTLGVSGDAIDVAHPGLAPIYRKECGEREMREILDGYGLTPGSYIYHGGGLEIRKNTGALLGAYASLAASIGTTAPILAISGTVHPRTNPLATDVEGMIRDLGLQDRVKLLGFVPTEDLPALYRGAMLFVFPSLYEGFGLPVLEAMSQGTPVLAAETSSIPEVGGDAIAYFDVTKPGDLNARLSVLIADGTAREELSRRGKRRAEGFSYGDIAKAFIDTL